MTMRVPAKWFTIRDPEVMAPIIDHRQSRLTPMMQREYDGVEELNSSLSKLLFSMEKTDRNTFSGASNIGGYHSDTKLFERPEPEIAAFRSLVQDAVADFAGVYIQETSSAPP